MIINYPHLCTKLEIWAPKYSKVHIEGEWVVLISKYKAHHSSPVILIEFTKAKHLKGQRFAIERSKAEKFPIVSNGRIDCYEIPFSELENWETAKEVREVAESIWN